MSAVLHPKKGDKGEPVSIISPSRASPLNAWGDPTKVATVTPGGAMPSHLFGQQLLCWKGSSKAKRHWEDLANTIPFAEPPLKLYPGKAVAAGAVVLEPDGRVWAVSPTNAFGGYKNTFPKGRVEAGWSLRATAIKEAWEEAGLQLELTAYLCDVPRTTTVTRYYLARRICGHPAEMGWESQAVHLVPLSLLEGVVSHANDQPVIRALMDVLSKKP